MKTEIIAPENQADHEIGLEIIRVLQLRRKRENGRIETTHGDKNPCGLARTLRHLTDEGQAARIAELETCARELLEFWDAETPVHPGALVVADLREVLARSVKREAATV